MINHSLILIEISCFQFRAIKKKWGFFFPNVNNLRMKSEQQQQQSWIFSPTFVFFFTALLLFGSIASLYAWLVFTPFVRTPFVTPSLGCQQDNEGSWSIGVFYGTSPFSLLPIEDRNVWKNQSAAWPLANPMITCASASEVGYPSNFVADPFLYIQIYMLPESNEKGELRLYRTVSFPLQWKLEKVLLKKPLVDSFLVKYGTKYWIFGSDHSSFGAIKNGRLEIWYSDSPLGPWKPHKKNPIYNTERSFGARNGGRPFVYDGSLYRVGQDCGETYGKQIRIFKVEILTEQEYKEIEVPSGFKKSYKGRNAWNGVRYHHLDVQQLSPGQWIAVMDGDRVPSGDPVDRFTIGCASVFAVAVLILLLGVLTGAVKCFIPLNWCPHNLRKRSDALLAWERPNTLSSKLRQFSFRLNRVHSFLRVWIKPNTFTGKIGVVLMCNGVTYIYGGNGAQEPYVLNGHYSQFTMLTMTYEARLWNLKMYVKHYSRCSSVKEIVVVWNKGKAPKPSEFDSAVPVRIRVEKLNSLNNRFNIDPLIKTRAVLELDDDIMMTCNDIERGFKVWREHPDRIVGFYPRLVAGPPLKYRAEKYARKRKGYNMILTGAAFMDMNLAFGRYWSEEAKVGRRVVDKFFNCEDVLLNYLYANASSSATVEYVKPAWAIDTSKFSSAAISRNTDMHYQKRTECLSKFEELYGSLSNRKSTFNQRNDGWDV
ncbi:Glycosyltransferase family protein 64 protein C5 [Bienertia sinuspersici]